MKTILQSLSALLIILVISSCKDNAPKYEETWESLSQHNETPEWFRDAKFGIYFHWSIYTVPEFGHEWYPARMYTPPNEGSLKKQQNFLDLGEDHLLYKKHERFNGYEHHLKTYGGGEKFGYKDFISGFTCENFDAEKWADLFERSGAKFAGPVAEHHDGYALWDSEHTPFCAGKTGPEIDIVGELAKAIKGRGMKFITTFHHAKNYRNHYASKERFEELGMDYSKVDLSDPKYAKMYGTLPEAEFMQMWKDKLKEVIDKYEPDIIWFDSWLDRIPEEHRMEFVAYYLNKAEELGKEVMICHKQQDLPMTVGTLDHERGAEKSITPYAWLSDDCVSPHTWSYVKDMIFYSPKRIITDFVKTVSKNGQLLFNITPKSNGDIPEEVVSILLEMGDWLQRNGEGIYSSRPWLIANESGNIHFTANKEGSVLYVFAFDKPEEHVLIRSLSGNAQLGEWDVKKVVQLGNGKELEFHQDETGLKILSDDIEWDDYATGLKISFVNFDNMAYTSLKEKLMAEYEKSATYGIKKKKK
jgi:alpha-L-fucosidase